MASALLYATMAAPESCEACATQAWPASTTPTSWCPAGRSASATASASARTMPPSLILPVHASTDASVCRLATKLATALLGTFAPLCFLPQPPPPWPSPCSSPSPSSEPPKPAPLSLLLLSKTSSLGMTLAPPSPLAKRSKEGSCLLPLRGFWAFMANAPLLATLHLTAIRHIVSALYSWMRVVEELMSSNVATANVWSVSACCGPRAAFKMPNACMYFLVAFCSEDWCAASTKSKFRLPSIASSMSASRTITYAVSGWLSPQHPLNSSSTPFSIC
mmetsp:Transcript_2595/g.5956  ORF Transcript_2595/g.5956 Transcript_2595/m.5956 type:complete len:276 (-) Transcript_2595:1856-2683(-)